jgi:hypothetical protein
LAFALLFRGLQRDMKFLGTFKNGIFYPTEHYAEKYYNYIKKLESKKNNLYINDIKQSRETPTHGALFYLINKMFESQEHFRDAEAFRSYLLCRIDFCYVFKFKGEMIKTPRSLSFENCDELEAKRVLSLLADLGEEMKIIDDTNRHHFLKMSASER